MAGNPATDLRPTDDGYARYYAEKLWSWIPEVHRDADFTSNRTGVLRALIEVVAGDAATARRSIDRLWEDVLIDYADEWAVPYIGDLLGTRLLESINGRGVRVDVARTLPYRRRAGTPVVLEELIKDITGWGGTVSEAFTRLGRYWHGLDADPYAIPPFATPPGGMADLRSTRLTDRLDGPFDGYAHRPDFRRLSGRRGRYAIPKLNVHLFRQKPIKIDGTLKKGPPNDGLSMGLKLAPGWYSFDPSGRDVQLFSNNMRMFDGKWRRPEIWHMPAPIPRALLNHALFAIEGAADTNVMTDAGPNPAAAAVNLANIRQRFAAIGGTTIEGVEQLLEFARLNDNSGPVQYPTAHDFRALQQATAQVESCAKYQLYGTGLKFATGTTFGTLTTRTTEEIMAADLAWSGATPTFPTGIRAFIDPVRGRVFLNGENCFAPELYHYGQFDPVGAGGYDRNEGVLPGANALATSQTGLAPIPIPAASLTGFDEFPKSKTYFVQGQIGPVSQMRLQAANFTRPYVRLQKAPGGGQRAEIRPLPLDPAIAPDDKVNQRTIEIDGLWLAVDRSVAEQQLAGPTQFPDPLMTTIVLDGRPMPLNDPRERFFHRVHLKHCTLDPGGERGRLEPCKTIPIPFVRLLVKGRVEELVIENSIVGIIAENEAAEDPCSIGKLIVRDSIIQSIDDAAHPAISLKSGELHIDRSTVFGRIETNRLFASELLVTGVVKVVDNQHGCFRFSAAPRTPEMRLPRQYESHIFDEGIPPHVFVSQWFGDAGYAQLSQTAPQTIATGGENGSEIGVFNRALAPIRAADLRTKFDEYAPMNTIGQLIYET